MFHYRSKILKSFSISLLMFGVCTGIQQKKGVDFISKEATRRYHAIGEKLLLDKYCEMGVIDQKTRDDLHQWTKANLYSRNSPEYHELLKELQSPTRHQQQR